MSTIELLWSRYELPTLDALHFADGRSYDVDLDAGEPGGMKVAEQFDLDGFLDEEPEGVTQVDGQKAVPLSDGGVLWGGEGAHGSNGFCARLNADLTLVWAVFFQDSNPFTDIRISGDVAVFASTSGVSIAVHIDDPLRVVGQA
ncbi:hypothetical protein [Streptomyces sp. NPDC050738]|uniref:hypothetical protein n=1 Tax=Streptomyces sp. NPDC050738 TaxID=3154744 RepID=UPI00341544E3